MQEVHSPIRTEARSHNLCGQILDSILSYVGGIIIVNKANVYNHIKAGGLHDWAKKKFAIEVWMHLFFQNTSGQLLLWLNTVSIWKQNSPYSVDVCMVLILVIYEFTKRSSVTFVYIIFSFVVLNSQEILILFLILLTFNSTVLQTYVPAKSLLHASYHCINWFSSFFIL